MIRSKEELKEYLAADNAWYAPKTVKGKVTALAACYPGRRIKKYLFYLRKQEYYVNSANGNKIKGAIGIMLEGKKNRLGEKLGIEIGVNCFGKGLQVYHSGLIINPAVRAGENCILHGGNCIGNNGITEDVPKLGNHVEVGYGAVLIGNIQIADNCIIGANALVNRSFTEPGSVIAGVPARKIN